MGAGTFSPNISQQEYTRLFTSEGVSITSVSDYRSDGQFRQLATQSGFFGNTAWSLDIDYQHNDGVRPNNDLDRVEWYSHIKQQVTPSDTALLLIKFQDYHSGDNFQYLDRRSVAKNQGYISSFRFDEEQKPIAVAGWRHEWAPNVQTLALVGRLENDQRFNQDGVRLRELITFGGIPFAQNMPEADLRYRGRLEIYTAEINQIAQFNPHTLVVGGRFQVGDIRTDYRLDNTDSNSLLGPLYPDEVKTNRTENAIFRRWSLYAYEHWAPCTKLTLIAGISYDDLLYPANFRNPPLQSGEVSKGRILPKAGIIWNPSPRATLRGMFAKSQGGVSLDESFRLEPVQLAGFSQTFRTLIPESIVGSVAAPGFDVGGVALDLKLPARIYVGLRGDILRSDVDQQLGLLSYDILNFSQTTPAGTVESILQQLRFRENAATLTLDKLLGEQWSIGGTYRFQASRLEDRLPMLGTLNLSATDLHEFDLRAGWNHTSGWFARTDARWLLQDHVGGNEDTCQVNLQIGWRFPRQRGEVSAGILNLLGNDYRLHPLSGLPEFARERVFFGRLKFYF